MATYGAIEGFEERRIEDDGDSVAAVVGVVEGSSVNSLVSTDK